MNKNEENAKDFSELFNEIKERSPLENLMDLETKWRHQQTKDIMKLRKRVLMLEDVLITAAIEVKALGGDKARFIAENLEFAVEKL